MKQLFLITISFLLGLNLLYAQPTNNPYTEKYGIDSAHWTNRLPWSKVYNINDYTGVGWDEILEKAQTDVAAKGGGVIYFPAGTYEFKDHVTIKKHIIIRGETPSNIDATSDMYAPPTRWVFPQYIPTFTGNGTPNNTAFKRIRSEYRYHGTFDSMPDDANFNTGMVYIDINRANLIFHPSYYNQSQPGHSTNIKPCLMDRVILFGLRINNCAIAYPYVPTTWGWQNDWQRWPWHYMANIDALVQEKLVVCNNRMNDYENNKTHPISDDSFDQPRYVVLKEDTLPAEEGSKARFEYNDHYGLVVNRFYNYYDPDYEGYPHKLIILGGLAVTPEDEPSIFGREVEIKDNWLYQTKRCAMFVAGQGMVIKDNVIRDDPDKVRWVGSAGVGWLPNDAYLENRGIDFSGWDILIEGNDVEVYPAKLTNSTYLTNDGEGIMTQECCGGSTVQNYTIRNNKLMGNNAYIGLYKSRNIKNVLIENNDLQGKNIYVNANTNSTDYYLHNVTIKDNYNVGSITVTGTAGGVNSVVKNNEGTGSITRSCYVEETNNTGFTVNDCTPIIDMTNEDDTICSTFEGYTFCLPNVEKINWLCTQENGFPQAELVAAKDTFYILDTTNTIEITTNISGDAVDSFELWNGNAQIAQYPVNKTTITVDIFENTSYYFKIYVKDSCGKDDWSNSIYVKKYDAAKDPTLLFVNNVVENKFLIYPNPANNRLNIRNIGDCQQKSTLKIMDISGRILMQQTIEKTEITVDIQQLKQGVYLLMIENNEQKIIKKFVKK